MPSRLDSWIVALGIATAVPGCAWMESSSGSKMVDHPNHYRLAIADVAARVKATEYSPTESIKNTIADVVSILGNEGLKHPGRSEERRQQIETVIRHHVNIGHMAQHSLGAHWTRLDNVEREEFVRLFIQLIRDRVANKIDQYYDQRVYYLFERREGNFAEVRTNLIGPKVDTSVDFRLENYSGEWLVYDVIIDGASIVWNYRTQFSSIIQDQSYAGLVERMKQRALTVKGFERPAPALALLPTNASVSQ